jgi:hypothetical protein
VGAVGTTATYLTAVSLDVLPGKPLLLAYAFLLTQMFGQLMVGAAPLLKQYFLPAGLTFALILSVPSSGGTVTPDLLPTPFRYLSDALPLAQAVDITRSVAYFHNANITQPTLIMLLWAAIAAGTVAFAWLRQPRTEPTEAPPSVVTSEAVTRSPDSRTPSQVLSAVDSRRIGQGDAVPSLGSRPNSAQSAGRSHYRPATRDHIV